MCMGELVHGSVLACACVHMVQAAELMVTRAAELYEAGEPCGEEANMVRNDIGHNGLTHRTYAIRHTT